tara:strand:+ start:85 stop:930 length:846 start_codon:yes stop_codon:yes gene_type:complete
MITVEYSGGLGNCMFKRAAAEVFSQALKIKVDDSNVPPNRHGDITRPNKYEKICTDNEVIYYGENFPAKGQKENAHYILPSRTAYLKYILDPTPRRIKLRGCFQKSWMYLDYRDFFKTFFKLPKPSFTPHRDDVCLNIRRNHGGTKELASKNKTPLEYFTYVIKQYFPENDLYIITDNGQDEDVKYLQNNFNVKSVYDPCDGGDKCDAIKSLSQVASFNNIVGSLGTFCWWAIFLSDAKNIILPIQEKAWGYNNSPNIDLYLDFANYIHFLNYEKMIKGIH